MYSNKFEHWTYTDIELDFNNDSWIWFGKAFASEIFQNKKLKTGDYGGVISFSLINIYIPRGI